MKQKFKGDMVSWTITDDSIKYGGIFKKELRLSEIGHIRFCYAYPPEEGEVSFGYISVYRLKRTESNARTEEYPDNVIWDNHILLSYRYEQQEEAVKAVYYMIHRSGMSEKCKREEMWQARETLAWGNYDYDFSALALNAKSNEPNDKKDASVIAGSVVADVGASNAVDKNNCHKK
jgi:hypothetical protein